MAFSPKKMTSSQKGPLLGGLASLMKLKASFGKSSNIQRSPSLGGESSLAKLREKVKKPSQLTKLKEEKKDTSAFQGKTYLRRDEVRRWLKRPEAWKITKIPAKDRPALEKKLFDIRKFGNFIDPKEVKIVYKDFENYPTRVKKRYGIKSKSERVKTFNLLKKFLGK